MLPFLVPSLRSCRANESEERDRAFELLEAYIERESEAGERADYDRVRGLVPHMRKRLWKASSREQASPLYSRRRRKRSKLEPLDCRARDNDKPILVTDVVSIA